MSKREIPQPSTNANDIVIEISFMVPKTMHQDGITLHATNRIFNEDTHLT